MNFYNPYMYAMPATSSGIRGFLSKLNLSSIISGTSKTLNLINQAIPVVKQVSPMMKNAKTMFKIMNEFKKTEPKKNNEISSSNNDLSYNDLNTTNYEGPTFFV